MGKRIANAASDVTTTMETVAGVRKMAKASGRFASRVAATRTTRASVESLPMSGCRRFAASAKYSRVARPEDLAPVVAEPHAKHAAHREDEHRDIQHAGKCFAHRATP
jgi:hypothetical protein